jgi:hypothetical protein
MPYFDRFDVCEAHYLFATSWHRGQWSPEYQVFGRLHAMRFKPSPLLSAASLSENGRDILASLIRRARRGIRTHRNIT